MSVQVWEMGAGATGFVQIITPDEAKAFLGQNQGNRKVNNTFVDTLARDMAAGNWRMTGEPIKFDTEGRLIDGQHRLQAVVKSGQSIQFFVITGLAPETQFFLDAGRKRTVANVFQMQGVKDANVLAAVARLANGLETGQIRTAFKNGAALTHAEGMAWAKSNPDAAEALRRARNVYKELRFSVAAVSTVLYYAWLVDGDKAFTWFEDLAEVKADGKGDPKSTLIRRMRHAQSNHEVMSATTVTYLIAKAYDAFRQGKPLNSLPLTAARAGVPNSGSRMPEWLVAAAESNKY